MNNKITGGKLVLVHFFSLIIFVFIVVLSVEAGAVKCVFKDPQYSFQCLRTIGYTASGGADIGECLNTAYRIKEGDDESWYNEWFKTADRVETTANLFFNRGHKRSAKEAYFRASNYYRNAGFFLVSDPFDPRIMKTWNKSRSCFLKAAKLSDTPIKFIRIPFEKTTLPGYLCLVDNSGKKRPLLIIHSGFDGTAEELYFGVAFAAVKRGYNCLLFEGPGQGEIIRKEKIPFRPDWETVVKPVVDFALLQPEVDPHKIALMGISFGGYLAPRAAAFEPRLKACIANGGVYDFYDSVIKKNPPDTEEIINNKEASKEFDRGVLEEMKKNADLRWVFGNGMWTFGAASPSEWLKMLKPYNMKDTAGKINCAMLVLDSEGDKDLPGQARQLYDALECHKEYMVFSAAEGAEEHCQMGAIMISNERILNWLDNFFASHR